MGCGCLFALIAMLSPRLALFLLWLFNPALTSRPFDNWILPVLGFFLLPWTTLVYILAWTPQGLSPFGWIFIIFAFLVDLASYGGGWWGRRGRS